MVDNTQLQSWSIIEYDDDTIQILPECWSSIDNDGNQLCYWPSINYFISNKHYISAVKKCIIPKPDWPIYGATILGTYDDFVKAMKKLKKAENNISLTTDTENDRVSRKNGHKRVYTSSDDSCQEDSSILKKIKAIPKPPTVENIIASSSKLIKDKSQRKLYHPVEEEMKLNQEKEVLNTPATQSNIRSTGSSPVSNKQNSKLLSNEDFQQIVLEQLKSIKLNLIRLEEQISSLQGRSFEKNDSDSDTEINIFEHFPLIDENKMHIIEEKLKNDKAYKKKLLNVICKIGGSKTDDITKLILRKLFTDELAALYNWTGAKGKKSLSSLLISKIIIDAVLKNIKDGKESEVIDCVKNWLRHAEARYKNRLSKEKTIIQGEAIQETPTTIL